MKPYTIADKIIEPDNKFSEYLNRRIQQLNWTNEICAQQSKVSKGEISKIRTAQRQGVSAKKFYLFYTAFGDSCEKATKQVYPNLNLSLKRYKPKERNEFGKFMQQFETNINSTEEIAAKTGIDENRLKELYYRRGALEAYELLLIEKAIGKRPGVLFEELYKK